MENNKIQSYDLIDIMPLDTDSNKLAQDIINEPDVNEVQKLVKMFNLNQAKKNVIRVLKYNALADKLADEALNRAQNHSDELNTSELMSFIQVANAAIDRANKSLTLVDEAPAIVINQVNNINVDEPLSRESRNKINDAVKAILNKSKELSVIEEKDIEDNIIINKENNNIDLLKNEEE